LKRHVRKPIVLHCRSPKTRKDFSSGEKRRNGDKGNGKTKKRYKFPRAARVIDELESKEFCHYIPQKPKPCGSAAFT